MIQTRACNSVEIRGTGVSMYPSLTDSKNGKRMENRNFFMLVIFRLILNFYFLNC